MPLSSSEALIIENHSLFSGIFAVTDAISSALILAVSSAMKFTLSINIVATSYSFSYISYYTCVIYKSQQFYTKVKNNFSLLI